MSLTVLIHLWIRHCYHRLIMPLSTGCPNQELYAHSHQIINKRRLNQGSIRLVRLADQYSYDHITVMQHRRLWNIKTAQMGWFCRRNTVRLIPIKITADLTLHFYIKSKTKGQMQTFCPSRMFIHKIVSRSPFDLFCKPFVFVWF